MTRFFMNLFDVFPKFMYTLRNYNLLLLFLRLAFLRRGKKECFQPNKQKQKMLSPRTYFRLRAAAPSAERKKSSLSNLLIEKINRETSPQ